jgi:DHA1 family L-arabinose/isopropyl-beta-D-thiogalactopyranoside export protein-like MFS transporter/DHA1 family inner membrane transport protein
MIFDRRPWTAVVLPLVLITFALIGLYALGELQVPAVLFVGLAGMAYSALAVSLLSRTLQVAPGNTDLASAGTNTAFNVGIAAGAFIGGGLIDGAGVRSVALVGGMLTAAALTGMLAEPRLARSARMIPAAAQCRPTPRPQVGIRG